MRGAAARRCIVRASPIKSGRPFNQGRLHVRARPEPFPHQAVADHRRHQPRARAAGAGRDVIGLGAGEPDFDTPDHIKEAAIAAIRAGETKYTAVDGTPALKDAIVGKFSARTISTTAREEITVGTGGKQVLYNALHGDPEPGRRGGHPGPLLGLLSGHGAAGRRHAGLRDAAPTRLGFKLRPEDLEAAIGPRTRWVHAELAEQPHGCRLHEGRAPGADRRPRPSSRMSG